MPNPFGSRYGGAKRRADVLRGSQLAPRVRAAEASRPVKPIPMTAVRRGLLEAVTAGKVRYFPSSGWKCDGRAVNAAVRDCVGAGWAIEALDGDRRTIALTEAGRAAIGDGEPA